MHDRVRMRIIPHRVKPAHRRYVKHAVGRRRRGADWIAKLDFVQNLLFPACGEHIETAAARSEINPAIGDQR